MAKLRWTKEAEQWLKDIFEYISHDNPAAARKVLAGIYDKAQLLLKFPELGQKYRTERGCSKFCVSLIKAVIVS